MRFTTYTKEQVDGLVANKNVLKFSGTFIAYTAAFKERAVNQYLNEGMSPKQIFKQAGFDLSVISKYKPSYLVYDWLKVFKAKGVAGFKEETRGRGTKNKGRRRSKTVTLEGLTDAQKVKRLKLEIEYLKKENDFLAKLRVRKTE